MVLADILLEIKKDISFSLNFFHMNYNMHSKSEEMYKYCNVFSSNNNINIFNSNIDSQMLFNNKNIESQAREIRYKKLKDICLKNNIDYILTGHHENDQIETIYMCQKNNSSWISKIGIRQHFNLYKDKEHSIKIFRPMLEINKKDIL